MLFTRTLIPVLLLAGFFIVHAPQDVQAATFAIGDRVTVSDGPLRVRSAPSLSSTILGEQTQWYNGTIVGGPVTADGYVWWNVNYDAAPDGWSAENFLAKLVTPAVVTLSASNVTSTGATLRGTVNPLGVSAEYFFSWGTSQTSLTPTAIQPVGSGSTAVTVSQTISGLTPDTTYTYKIIARNFALGGQGSFVTFHTPPLSSAPAAPSKTSANTISSSIITLLWQDNADNETGFYVERRTGSGSYARVYSAPAKSGVGSGVSFENGSLQSNTTYCYRVQAYNSQGVSAYSSESCATTQQSSQTQPAVTTLGATSISSAGATLNGSINPNGVTSNAFFQWGTAPTFGNLTTPVSVGGGTSPVGVSHSLSGLSPSTVYYYRLVGVGAQQGSQEFGSTNSFQTDAGGLPGDPGLMAPWEISVAQGDPGAGLISGYRFYLQPPSGRPFAPITQLDLGFPRGGGSGFDLSAVSPGDISTGGSTDAATYVPDLDSCSTATSELYLVGIEVDADDYWQVQLRACPGDTVNGYFRVHVNNVRNPFEASMYQIVSYASAELDGDLSVGIHGSPTLEPTCSLRADPLTIQQGESSTLTLESTYAHTLMSLTGVPGDFDTDGTVEVSPDQTTTYTGTWVGEGGEVQCSVTVTVAAPAAQCEDGIDNDGDGLVDDADAGCGIGTYGEFSDDIEKLKLNIFSDVIYPAAESLFYDINESASIVNGDVLGVFLEGLFYAIDLPDDVQSIAINVKQQFSAIFTEAELRSAVLDAGFDPGEVEVIARAYADVPTYDEQVKIIRTTYLTWIQREVYKWGADIGLSIEAVREKFEPLESLFRFFVVTKIPETALTSLEYVHTQHLAEITSALSELGKPGVQLERESYERFTRDIHRRYAANIAMANFLNARALQLSVMTAAENDLAFRLSSLFWGLGKASGGLLLSMADPVHGPMLVLADSTAELYSSIENLRKDAEMYIFGLDSFESSGVYSTQKVFMQDISGAVSANILSSIELLSTDDASEYIPSAEIVDVYATGDNEFTVAYKNTGIVPTCNKLIVRQQTTFDAHTLSVVGIPVPYLTWEIALENSSVHPDANECTTVDPGRIRYVPVAYSGDLSTITATLLERNNGHEYLADQRLATVDSEGGWFSTYKVINLQSPGELRVRDMHGNVTGLVDGVVVEDIPDSLYDPTNHFVLLFDPEETYEYDVFGTGDGTYGLAVADVDHEEVDVIMQNKAIPIEPGVVHTYTEMGNEYGTEMSMSIDIEGDGVLDAVFPIPSTFTDTQPPLTSASLLGEQTRSMVYTSSVELALHAVDSGSRVRFSEYSDDGVVWLAFVGTTTVTSEGVHTIYFRSVDWFGNVEEPKSVSFEIVSAQGLLEETLEWADTNVSQELLEMLKNALREKFWEDRNTLVQTGSQGVLSHIKNALKFLEKGGHDEQHARLLIAKEIVD